MQMKWKKTGAALLVAGMTLTGAGYAWANENLFDTVDLSKLHSKNAEETTGNTVRAVVTIPEDPVTPKTNEVTVRSVDSPNVETTEQPVVHVTPEDSTKKERKTAYKEEHKALEEKHKKEREALKEKQRAEREALKKADHDDNDDDHKELKEKQKEAKKALKEKQKAEKHANKKHKDKHKH
ncbi:hypothetical protein ACIQYS_12910 [Psychrobacillus sp. NPDC096426]|uniref:hypothetical protein n=1 Tax=Psychrobacillus sp. NPDC096426 TaxID=3364491 RepID=UPI00381E9EDE